MTLEEAQDLHADIYKKLETIMVSLERQSTFSEPDARRREAARIASERIGREVNWGIEQQQGSIIQYSDLYVFTDGMMRRLNRIDLDRLKELHEELSK